MRLEKRRNREHTEAVIPNNMHSEKQDPLVLYQVSTKPKQVVGESVLGLPRASCERDTISPLVEYGLNLENVDANRRSRYRNER